MTIKEEEINNLRAAMGTLPSQFPEKETRIVKGCTELEVKLIDFPSNYAKVVCAAATSTWGDDKYEDKWQKLTPENRYKVVLAALTGNTLPLALESFIFTFKVNGCPRHSFDQWARARYATFYSIGSRDNSKLDSRIILYTKLYDKCYNKNKKLTTFGKKYIKHMLEMKDLYEEIIKDRGSWQIARDILTMSYNHSFHFSINYLALQGQCGNRMKFCEEEQTCGIAWLLREEIKKKSPFLANFLRPSCDKSNSCQYAKSYNLSQSFGCLFSGCKRHPSGTEYATFNESCTDVVELEKQLNIKIPRPTDWIQYDENSYDKLDAKDKKLFEED